MLTNMAKQSKPFKEYLNNALLVHVICGYLVLSNLEYFIPKVIDQKSHYSALSDTREAYRSSMRDSVEMMQKVQALIEKMQAQAQRSQTQEAEALPLDEMDIPTLYETSNTILANIEQITSERDIPESIPPLDPALEMSEQAMLDKMKENQQAAVEALAKMQLDQAGTDMNLSQGDAKGNGSQAVEGEGGASQGEPTNKANSQGQELAAQEAQQFLAQQQSSKQMAEQAKGYQKDFTQMLKTAYGDGSEYRFDNIAANKQAKPLSAPAISIYNTNMASQKISATATQKARWLMLDSWYVIGPFDNTNRQHINTAFPPENNVDFDAKYIGKQGKIIQWHYQKFDNFPITPVGLSEFEVYYAYTQIKLDKAQDVWLAVGSDDQSKLWLNNLLVWTSIPQHKGWRIGEGFRKVHLKAGINTMLFRLENGHYGGGFTVALAGE